MKVYNDLFEQMASVQSLFQAWDEFKKGKQKKTDVMKFELNLEENIFALRHDLINKNYKHSSYYAFYITDPKQRLIHKASVRDRVLHHAMFNTLNPIFEPTFIANSFSCRIGKGTHKGVRTLATILRAVSRNHTRPCYALKCDISKFFASVDHEVLLNILQKRIKDQKVLKLTDEIIRGFNTDCKPGTGLPIGNLTSQLFANVYMNEFDHYVKHHLKARHYVRYTDDFIIAASRVEELKDLIPRLQEFLGSELKLELHSHKVTIRKYISGVDFLGYVIFPHHTKLRTKTRRRVLNRVCARNLSSYLGVCSHANTHELQQLIKTIASKT